MYKITDLEELGTEFTITNPKGDILRTVQIIDHTEIIAAAIGEFNEDYEDISTYLTGSIECLSGYEEANFYDTLWHTYRGEYDIAKLVETVMKYNYRRVIVEELID